MAKTEYVLLADMLTAWAQGGQVTVIRLDEINEETPMQRQLAVPTRAIIGIRRQIVTVDSNEGLVEKRQPLRFAPWTPTLVRLARDFYRPITGWNYDFPNPRVEDAPTRQDEGRLIERLLEQVKILPMDIQITGVQRRYLLYYSDGNKNTQIRYLRLAPKPGRDSPFDQDWELREGFRKDSGDYGTPLLYDGPAWFVRFTVDGVDPIPDCRVYVDDDARFICSDWCQRTGYTTYGKGIDLQVQGYTLGSWIAGPVSQQGRITLPPGSRITIMNQAKQQRRHLELDEKLAAIVPTVQAAWISGFRTLGEIYTILETRRASGRGLIDVPVMGARIGIDVGRYSVGAHETMGQYVDVNGAINATPRHHVSIYGSGLEYDIADLLKGPLGEGYTPPSLDSVIKAAKAAQGGSGGGAKKEWTQVVYEIKPPEPIAPIAVTLDDGSQIVWTGTPAAPAEEGNPPFIAPNVAPNVLPQPAQDSWEDIPPPEIPVHLPDLEQGNDFGDDDEPHAHALLGALVLGKPSPVCHACITNYTLDIANMEWVCNECGAGPVPFHYVKSHICEECGGATHFTPDFHQDLFEDLTCVWCHSTHLGGQFYGAVAYPE